MRRPISSCSQGDPLSGASRLHRAAAAASMVGGRWGGSAAMRRLEAVNESGTAEQTVQAAPIKAQSAAVARATASICNAEWGRLDGMSGRGGFVHSFSVY